AGQTEGDEADRGRRIAARRVVSMDATGPQDEPLSAMLADEREPAADEAFAATRRSRKLIAALQELPNRQREALEMGLFEGMALKEIGERMGVSESRVCQLQKRAVEHLHAQLAEAA